ncbi:hypothetical protein AB1Y20_023546 [Prymnesium parvum]|uniref:DUF1415 domain-containing protein n=1 Tax=Prymnesium parvum TaxID=97485 RepID=A0AB34JE72_PRYPA
MLLFILAAVIPTPAPLPSLLTAAPAQRSFPPLATTPPPAEPSALDAAAVVSTRRWISEVVIRLGLCPYASDAFHSEGKVRYTVSHAGDKAQLIDDFFTEGLLLLHEAPEEVVTTMLVAPLYEEGIEEFYSLYEWLVDTLEDEGETMLDNQIQPAFFHPNWTFSGIEPESPLHFEKRAPYPVINLLRRSQLDEVVKRGLKRGVVINQQIAEHNAAVLEQEGFARLKECFRRLQEAG